jgi:hypothetical protein
LQFARAPCKIWLDEESLNRYAQRNENFVPVRSQDLNRCGHQQVLGCAQEDNCRPFQANGVTKRTFWLLTSGFSYPAVFWRDIKGEALA